MLKAIKKEPVIPWYWERFDLFAGLSPEARDEVMNATERREYRRGSMVFRANDPASRIYMLEEGRVKIFHLSGQGEITVFWFCVPGDLFGAGGISGAEEQSVNAQVQERAVIRSLSRGEFERLLHLHPQLAINVIRQVSGRLRLACDAVADKTGRRAEARLARVLMRLARNWGESREGEIRFHVRITHQELAYLVGSCRQTVNRVLNQFARQGVIRFEQRTLIVCRPDTLAEYMED
ncbi:transcriptional regulator, Crp/Fnr family [Azotobacter vinelandii CA]|uniref:Transcriptional regulator, Crp/Fnr family n=2 Tax=Azotobacter vinelandii TaxID=354 RepID=C1DG80_AZOVD|nr:Crp/Fnr family transcriptional regulator [Azotobacter vinelandii]ACO78391.1 transcriptional regulator, Crp/Fnr family [Azotobacter vinelandii DJ]AGK15030.1 transcriptional regulator, Crp/Fnr family [Azotobacter vinelandii CA]AGK20469.1 transcriptional regulator, Crp/Fnr family [Azotobacter vinelandii CA6]WKN24098.1 Crp/Fnr family transcriptional regulator [Azotobacter vinelandii]SFY20738.1 cAMP-binding domain of CRP or a regulatory subunit of cAMP-dependent protein kinases [Azotobacter vine